MCQEVILQLRKTPVSVGSYLGLTDEVHSGSDVEELLEEGLIVEQIIFVSGERLDVLNV